MSCVRCVYTQCQVTLMNQLRMLWEQHVHWTRSFIISTAASLESKEAVTARLLRNPKDFAAVFRKYYGCQIAEAFEELFRQHLLIAADFVNAAVKADAHATGQARQKWFANADDIAAFLASINRCWSEEKWKMLFYSHLEMTEQETVYWLEGKYKESICMYDEIEAEALKMADYMYYGICKQFNIC